MNFESKMYTTYGREEARSAGEEQASAAVISAHSFLCRLVNEAGTPADLA